jgi:hypothetical protein
MVAPALLAANLPVRQVVADELLVEDVLQTDEKLVFRVGVQKTVGPAQRGVDPVAALQGQTDEVLAQSAAQMEKQQGVLLALEVLEPVRPERRKRALQLQAVQTV